MVMIKDKEGIERYSYSTKLNLFSERCKQKIHQEDSMVLGIVWGKVGSGKSVWSQHFAHAIDNSIDIKRICFDKEEYIEAILHSRKKAVVGDEGISLFFSRAAMTKEGRLINELMAQCRQKNLAIIICVPEILSVDWLILQAADFVVYVWEGSKKINNRKVTTKGNAAIFPAIVGDDFKTRIIHYKKMKKRNPYAKVRMPRPWITEPGNPIGETFKEPWYPVGEELYRNKKESILKKYSEPQNKDEEKKPKKITREVKSKVIKEQIRTTHMNNPQISQGELSKIFKIGRKTVNIALRGCVCGYPGAHIVTNRNLAGGSK
jgi:ABC-type dipeptide/oligopeptide/nickel transport system ATPase component